MIENLNIKPTLKMPEVLADAETGEISISGKIGAQNCEPFFKPIDQWFNRYFIEPKKLTRLNFRISYLSQSGSLMLLELLKLIEVQHLSRKKIVIYWYCNLQDQNMFEIGDDYKDLITTPFHIVMED